MAADLAKVVISSPIRLFSEGDEVTFISEEMRTLIKLDRALFESVANSPEDNLRISLNALDCVKLINLDPSSAAADLETMMLRRIEMCARTIFTWSAIERGVKVDASLIASLKSEIDRYIDDNRPSHLLPSMIADVAVIERIRNIKGLSYNPSMLDQYSAHYLLGSVIVLQRLIEGNIELIPTSRKISKFAEYYRKFGELVPTDLSRCLEEGGQGEYLSYSWGEPKRDILIKTSERRYARTICNGMIYASILPKGAASLIGYDFSDVTAEMVFPNPVYKYIPGMDFQSYLDPERWTTEVDGKICFNVEAFRKATLPIVHDVLSFILRCKKIGIVHCDIKPENVVVKTARLGKRNRGYIIDPDFCMVSGTKSTGAAAGTAHFISPEILREGEDITNEIDIWAVGMILWLVLLNSEYLVKSEESEDYPYLYYRDLYSLSYDEIRTILYKSIDEIILESGLDPSEENDRIIDLMKRCLEPDPKKRITPEEALEHHLWCLSLTK